MEKSQFSITPACVRAVVCDLNIFSGFGAIKIKWDMAKNVDVQLFKWMTGGVFAENLFAIQFLMHCCLLLLLLPFAIANKIIVNKENLFSHLLV